MLGNERTHESKPFFKNAPSFEKAAVKAVILAAGLFDEFQ
jgi:hypothetical protein